MQQDCWTRFNSDFVGVALNHIEDSGERWSLKTTYLGTVDNEKTHSSEVYFYYHFYFFKLFSIITNIEQFDYFNFILNTFWFEGYKSYY